MKRSTTGRQAGDRWGGVGDSQAPLVIQQETLEQKQVCGLTKITVQGGYTSVMQRQRKAFIWPPISLIYRNTQEELVPLCLFESLSLTLMLLSFYLYLNWLLYCYCTQDLAISYGCSSALDKAQVSFTFKLTSWLYFSSAEMMDRDYHTWLACFLKII